MPESEIPQDGHDRWLTRAEAAAHAYCSVSKIDRAVADGSLQSVKNGRQRRFRRTWIDAWLAGGQVAVWLLAVAFALALVCYCHALHVSHGPHCIWF